MIHFVFVKIVNDEPHVVLTLGQALGGLDDVEPPAVGGFPVGAIPVVVPSHKLAVHIVVAK